MGFQAGPRWKGQEAQTGFRDYALEISCAFIKLDSTVGHERVLLIEYSLPRLVETGPAARPLDPPVEPFLAAYVEGTLRPTLGQGALRVHQGRKGRSEGGAGHPHQGQEGGWGQGRYLVCRWGEACLFR